MRKLLMLVILASAGFIFTPVVSAHYRFSGMGSVANPWPYWMGQQVVYTQPQVVYVYPQDQTMYQSSQPTQYITPGYSYPSQPYQPMAYPSPQTGIIPGTPPQTMGITPGNPGNFSSWSY